LSPRQYLFVAPKLRFSIDQFDLYAGDLRFAEYSDQTFYGGVDFGVNFTQYGEARLGALVGTRKFDLQSGGVFVDADSGTVFATPRTGNFNVGAFTFSAKLDRLDSITFPRHGYYARANIYASSNMIGADEPYTRWDALLSAPVTFGRHTVEALVAGGGKIGPEEIPVYDQFGLGGFLKL